MPVETGKLRSDVIAALEADPGLAQVNVYTGAGGTVRPPALWVAPGEPYLTRNRGQGYEGLLDIVLVASREDDRRAIDKLEDLADLVIPVIDGVAGAEWRQLGDIFPVEVAGASYLAATLQVVGDR